MKILKKISLPIVFMLIFAACKNNNDETRSIQLLSDSSAYNNSSTTDSIKARNENTGGPGSYRYHPKESETKETKSVKSNSDNGTVSNNETQTSTNTTQSPEKKGWSKAAQGAVIGGATGAVGGAIISKHKGTGAAVGAAVGAAGGYIIGHEKDKKDGRIKDKKK